MFKMLLFLMLVCVASALAETLEPRESKNELYGELLEAQRRPYPRTVFSGENGGYADGKPQNETMIDRIVGGSPATKNQFKFIVLFKWITDNSKFCSGSLVSIRKVLTSAFCAQIMFNRLQHVNAILYTLSPNPDQDAVTRRVTGLLIHPNYNPTRKTWNLSIVTLGLPAVDFVPISIDYNINLNGATLTALGWGYNNFPGVQNLRSAAVQTIQPQMCANYYGNTYFGDGNYYCLLGIGVASCATDQGAPIISGSGFLVGVNNAADCKMGQPIVAVRLRNYANWIRSNIN